MIIVMGTDGDFTFHALLRQCVARRVPIQPINLRAIIGRGDWCIDVSRAVGNVITVDDEVISLDAQRQVFFFRPCLPIRVHLTELEREKWKNIVTGLSSWMTYHRVRVINVPWHRDDNGFKSLHGHLLAKSGMRIPEAVVSSNIKVLKNFCRLDKTIAKSHAGVRANAQICTEEKLCAYESSSGPLFLQRFIAGRDLRVHTIGKKIFSVAVSSAYADYRADPEIAAYKPCSVPRELHELMIQIAKQCGLYLAGWDFKIDSEERFWCLEVNPMPGYGSYESERQEISDTIVDALLEGLP